MIKKILVPLDGSELAEKVLPYVEEQGQKLEAEIILLWALHPQVIMSDYGSAAYQTIITLEEDEATTYLSDMQSRLQKKGLSVRTEIVDGPAAQEIIDFACQEKVDLIMKTTHGRSGPSRWVYGNVAAKVIQGAPCPVFLVRVTGVKC